MSQDPQNKKILQLLDFYPGDFTLTKSAMGTKAIFPLMAAAISAINSPSTRILKRKSK